jgi:hypothetical protein
MIIFVWFIKINIYFWKSNLFKQKMKKISDLEFDPSMSLLDFKKANIGKLMNYVATYDLLKPAYNEITPKNTIIEIDPELDQPRFFENDAEVLESKKNAKKSRRNSN